MKPPKKHPPQHRFIGRKNELATLRRLLEKQSASLVVVRGRRRIGKSRLLKEFAREMKFYSFSGLPPTKKTTAQDQRDEFARQLQSELKIALPSSHDWGNLLQALAEHTVSGRVVIVLDEINWIGSKDPNFLGKLKILWDQHFTNNPKLVLVLCGSISTWIEKNILSHTGFLGRISLDMVLEELSLSECNLFWEGKPVSAYEKFKILSVTGGVPRYLEEVLPHQSAEHNIEHLCFHKSGFLVSEFDRIFSDLFSKKNTTYKKIVRRLAEGPAELQDLYEALRVKKSGGISSHLKNLILSGFITQDSSWNFQKGKRSKFSRFRLKDNYLRFYLKYIEPYKETIEQGTQKLPLGWHSILGLQFENLVLNNRLSLFKALKIDPATVVFNNPYFQKKTIKRNGCQIDYLIQDRFGTCYLCEIKFSRAPLDSRLIAEVEDKLQSLERPDGLSFRPVLIHVGGVTEEVKESGFFAFILDFAELL